MPWPRQARTPPPHFPPISRPLDTWAIDPYIAWLYKVIVWLQSLYSFMGYKHSILGSPAAWAEVVAAAPAAFHLWVHLRPSSSQPTLRSASLLCMSYKVRFAARPSRSLLWHSVPSVATLRRAVSCTTRGASRVALYLPTLSRLWPP